MGHQVGSTLRPFIYPDRKHKRCHGPRGYRQYRGYRDWLRDEFCFRCVYCLRREQWGLVRGGWHIDHFVPQSVDPAATLDYENLLYLCAGCNAGKSSVPGIDPEDIALGDCMRVESDGTIIALNEAGKYLISLLRLDNEDYTSYRKMMIDAIELAFMYKRELFEIYMGYPKDLPDLSRLRPPGGNSRPEGIPSSHYERRKRGELSEVY